MATRVGDVPEVVLTLTGGLEGYFKRLVIVSQRPNLTAHQHRPMQITTAVQFRIWSRTPLAEVVLTSLDFGGRSTGMAYHPSKYRPKTPAIT